MTRSVTDYRQAASAAAMLIAASACSPIDFANAITSRDGYQIESDIPYGIGPRQTLDLYRPDEVKLGSAAVLFFYGGRWQFGQKEDYLFVGEALASQGFITMIADYRLFPEVLWRDFVGDAAAALRKAIELVDDRPIVLAGHSAGAHLAAMAALDQDLQASVDVDACDIGGLIGLAGPFDFLPLVEPDIIALFGPGKAGPETQPVTFAGPNDPPTLLIHGLDDRTVLPRNSRKLAAALQASGNDSRALFYEDVGHIGLIASFAWPVRFLSPSLLDTVNYLENLPEREGCSDD